MSPDNAELYELLDGYADGELTPEERSAVDGLLESSAHARAELADIERVRSLVRGLPAVDAPFGFFERMTLDDQPVHRRARRRGRAGVVVASIGAVAAAVVLVVAIAPIGDRLTPPVENLSERHTMLTSATRELPEGYAAVDADDSEMAAPYAAPAEVANGYRRSGAYRAPEGVHVLYSNDSSTVSVFEQRGRADWAGLPSGGTRLAMDGDDAWTATALPVAVSTTVAVIVLARDGLVVTVVGEVPYDDIVAIAEAVPDPPAPAMSERVGDTCDWIAEGFGGPPRPARARGGW